MFRNISERPLSIDRLSIIITFNFFIFQIIPKKIVPNRENGANVPTTYTTDRTIILLCEDARQSDPASLLQYFHSICLEDLAVFSS